MAFLMPTKGKLHPPDQKKRNLPLALSERRHGILIGRLKCYRLLSPSSRVILLRFINHLAKSPPFRKNRHLKTC